MNSFAQNFKLTPGDTLTSVVIHADRKVTFKIYALCLVKSPSGIKMNALLYSIRTDSGFPFSKSHNCRTKNPQ